MYNYLSFHLDYFISPLSAYNSCIDLLYTHTQQISLADNALFYGYYLLCYKRNEY
jgi:hypothetical protein